MTDFRQRQAISTLTAPAARGLTPHYLVQPGTRHALYPATGTLFYCGDIIAYLASFCNRNLGQLPVEYWNTLCYNNMVSWETGVNPVRGRRRDVETLSRYHEIQTISL